MQWKNIVNWGINKKGLKASQRRDSGSKKDVNGAERNSGIQIKLNWFSWERKEAW